MTSQTRFSSFSYEEKMLMSLGMLHQAISAMQGFEQDPNLDEEPVIIEMAEMTANLVREVLVTVDNDYMAAGVAALDQALESLKDAKGD